LDVAKLQALLRVIAISADIGLGNTGLEVLAEEWGIALPGALLGIAGGAT
jgi:hypothetical protein